MQPGTTQFSQRDKISRKIISFLWKSCLSYIHRDTMVLQAEGQASTQSAPETVLFWACKKIFGNCKFPLDFCQTKCYFSFARQKGVMKMSAAKLGRPSDNPRPNKISIRISDRSKKILDDYCERHEVNKTEAIERGIGKLTEPTEKEK